MIQKETIDNCLSVDITDIVGRVVKLKKSGVNYSGNCPFHDEKTPSFVVSPAKGIYKCFGCGKAGNGIGFVMEHEQLSFPDAVRKICKDHNIEIQEEKVSEEQQQKINHRDALFAANKVIMEWFRENLKSNEDAQKYLSGRWSDESVGTWQIGFAPESWDALTGFAREQGINTEILLELGLIRQKDNRLYDFFRNRIMFPIFDQYGRVAGFSGRILTEDKEQPKYVNSPDSEIFHKGEILYGMNFAHRTSKEKTFLHLVEGNPDVIRLHE